MVAEIFVKLISMMNFVVAGQRVTLFAYNYSMPSIHACMHVSVRSSLFIGQQNVCHGGVQIFGAYSGAC